MTLRCFEQRALQNLDLAYHIASSSLSVFIPAPLRQLLESILSIFMREPLAEWQREARILQKQQQQIAALQKQGKKEAAGKSSSKGGRGGNNSSGSLASPVTEVDLFDTEASHIRLKVGVESLHEEMDLDLNKGQSWIYDSG